MGVRLLVGCVAREVVAAVGKLSPNDVGITASLNQCGPGGYSGLDPRTLRVELPNHYLQRDHMREDTLDDDAALNGAFVDTDDEAAYLHAGNLVRQVEIGAGEDPRVDVRKRLALAIAHRCVIVSVSAYVGTALRDMNNGLDVGIARQAGAAWSGFGLRAHNCDFLSRSHLSLLRDAGVSSFNLAPQVGFEVTQSYLRYAGEDLRGWRNVVLGRGLWRRWTSDPGLAVELGGHYCLEQMPRNVRDRHFDDVAAHVRSFLREVLSWI